MGPPQNDSGTMRGCFYSSTYLSTSPQTISNWDSAQQNAEQFEEYWDETSYSLYLAKRVYTLYEFFFTFSSHLQ